MKTNSSSLSLLLPACIVLAPLLVRAQSDTFATATPITDLPVTGDNLTATKEPGESNHANNAGGASLWWSWTPPATGYYRVTLAGSSFDTLLAIYTGASVGTTLLVTQNDDSAAGVLTSAVVVYVRTGETILIAADGYSGAGVPATGTIVLDIVPLPAGEVPPVNDLFAAATLLPATTAGSAVSSNLYASREVGEPRLANMPGGTSLWWQWVAPVDGDMSFQVSGATAAATPVTFNTGLAVYTGATLATLTPVTSTGPALNNTVQFAVTTGTTYYITADAASTAFQAQVGNLTLRYTRTFVHTIFPSSVAWDWLHPAGIDPAVADTDFNSTWHQPAVYDGPAFNVAGGALLGFGVIDSAPIVTNIVDPGTGNRYTAYFRRQFTLTEDQTLVEAMILADDGAFIYLDGALVQTFNMPAGALDTYFQAALAGSEAGPSRVILGPLTAGVHEIAVSVHNSGPTSSDLGFSLSLFSDNTPDATMTAAGTGTGFEEPAVGATNYGRFTNGNAEFGWATAGGAVQSAAIHPAGQGVTPVGQFFRLNAARANPFLSDRISLAPLTPEQRAAIIASAKVRTFDTSSGFEIDDDLTITLQSSTDGRNFTTAADILPRTSGGVPDNLLAISQATGDYVQFSTTAGAVPAAATHVRIMISGGNNSASEHIYIDDLRIELSSINPLADTDGDGQSNASEAFAGTDPADSRSVLQVTAATPETFDPAPSFTVTFDGVAGKQYQIESSETLTGTWTVVRDNVAAPATGPVIETGVLLPVASRGFLRVRVKP